jgi:hypothetical protein
MEALGVLLRISRGKMMEFKEWLENIDPFSNIPADDGSSFDIFYSPIEIVFIKPDFFDNTTDVVVDVNVDKIDDLWKKDTEYYVPAFSKNAKYNQSYNNITNSKKAKMPKIGLNNGVIGFDDGRNTFAVIRDLGFEKIQVVINKSQIKDFNKLK